MRVFHFELNTLQYPHLEIGRHIDCCRLEMN